MDWMKSEMRTEDEFRVVMRLDKVKNDVDFLNTFSVQFPLCFILKN